MRENADQKYVEYGHFSHSVYFNLKSYNIISNIPYIIFVHLYIYIVTIW